MSEQTSAQPTPSPRFSLDWISLDSWAVAAAVLFVALVVVGIFPRVPW